jgi:hypothetical protein
MCLSLSSQEARGVQGSSKSGIKEAIEKIAHLLEASILFRTKNFNYISIEKQVNRLWQKTQTLNAF